MQDEVSANPMPKIKIGEYVFTKGMKRPDASDNVKLALFNAIDLLDGDQTNGLLSEKDIQMFNEKIKEVTATNNGIQIGNYNLQAGTKRSDIRDNTIKTIFDVIDWCDGKKSGILTANDVTTFKYRIENPIKNPSATPNKPNSAKPGTTNSGTGVVGTVVNTVCEGVVKVVGEVLDSLKPSEKPAHQELKVLPLTTPPTVRNLGLKVNSHGRIDMNQFSLNALKAKYGTDKYIYKEVNDKVMIYDKSTNQLVADFQFNSTSTVHCFILNDAVRVDYVIEDGYITVYNAFSRNHLSLSCEYTPRSNKLSYSSLDNYIDKSFSETKYDSNENPLCSRRGTNASIDTSSFYIDNVEYSFEKGSYIDPDENMVSLMRLLFSRNIDKSEFSRLYNKFDNIVKDNSSYFLRLISEYNGYKNAMFNTSMLWSPISELSDSVKLLKSDIQVSKNLTLNQKYLLSSLIDKVVPKEDISINIPARTSKINNPYYKGNDYNVQITDSIITIKNLQTSKVHKIDLKYLLKFVPKVERNSVMEILVQLPGEVLEDLAIEITKPFNSGNCSNHKIENAAAFYNPSDNTITVGCNNAHASLVTFVHELGHALSYMAIMGGKEFAFPRLSVIFNQELENYRKLGLPVFNERISTVDTKFGGSSNYATANEREMFAECYTLMMLGYCQSSGVILEYFPKTFEEVKKYVMCIKAVPDDYRNK